MARTTFKDRARKARIREREHRASMLQIRKLDAITDEQIETLKKIKAAEARHKPMRADSVADLADLKAMGVLSEHEGHVTLTSTGTLVVSHEGKEKEEE